MFDLIEIFTANFPILIEFAVRFDFNLSEAKFYNCSAFLGDMTKQMVRYEAKALIWFEISYLKLFLVLYEDNLVI